MSTSVIFWRRIDVEGLVRLEPSVEPEGVTATSTVVCLDQGGFRLDHHWRLDPDWRAQSVTVEGWNSQGRRMLRLERVGTGWRVDGSSRADLEGAEEPDLSIAPFCNTFPIRRTPQTAGESLTIDTAQPKRVNPEAYQAFLQGNYFLHQNIRGITKSIEWFRRAIELDSGQADAHAGLAHALVYTGIYEIRPPAQAYTEARAAAEKALQLDPSNAGAHNVLADVKKSFEWNLVGAAEEHRRVLQLSPSHLLTRLWLAETLSRLERHDEALAESARAVSLDPVSALSHNNRSMLLLRARRYDEAINEARIALELDPSHVNALWWQGLAYAEKRDFPRSLASLQKGFEMSKAPMFLASLGYAHARAGERNKAEDAIRELRALAEKRYVSGVNVATVYAGLDDVDATFEWLQKAYEARDGRIHQLVWPLFDEFRGDPRYLELKGRIGLR